MKRIIIQIHCKDKSGIIASVTDFISSGNGNIVYIDQHVDREQDIFFMRTESEFESFSMATFKSKFKTELANQFEMNWEIYNAEDKPKMALFVS
jgi:formyltetrahydrofolate deformylase